MSSQSSSAFATRFICRNGIIFRTPLASAFNASPISSDVESSLISRRITVYGFPRRLGLCSVCRVHDPCPAAPGSGFPGIRLLGIVMLVWALNAFLGPTRDFRPARDPNA
jgi:hypothetical protein